MKDFCSNVIQQKKSKVKKESLLATSQETSENVTMNDKTNEQP